MTTETQPYLLSIFWRDGSRVAIQFETKNVIKDDSGNVIFETPNPAEPLPLELSEDMLGLINAGLHASMAELEANHAVEIAAFQAQITALTAPPSPATTAFRSLPQEIQDQFEDSYQAAAILVRGGRPDLAILHIQSLTIPANLEPYRTQIIALLSPSQS